jgi:arylsulfatase A-like enzyme
MYDAEIAYADEFVGRIFDLVRQQSDRDTLVVVTGDHGDLFGECGVLGHNFVLHDGLTNVPLVLYGFDEVGDLSDGVVQHVDVTRTVARRLGVDADQFVGRDLRNGPSQYAISQRGVPDFDPYLESDPEFDASRYHPDPMTAVRTQSAKYVHSADRSELFALPDEETPVGSDRPDLVAELDAVRRRRIGDLPPTRDQVDRNRDESAFTEEMTEQLADLGYL